MWPHLYVKSVTAKLTETEQWLLRVEGKGKWGDAGQRDKRSVIR